MSDKPRWVVTEQSDRGGFEASDPLGEVVVNGSLNGCLNLWQYSGGGRFFAPSNADDADYWHVCGAEGIDALIDRLQALKLLLGSLERGETQAPCQHWYKASNATRSWCQACGAEQEPDDGGRYERSSVEWARRVEETARMRREVHEDE